MTSATPTSEEQDRVLLLHALDQIRESIDCLQLRSPGEAYQRLSALALRLGRHLSAEKAKERADGSCTAFQKEA